MKDIAALVASLATVGALLAGAFWFYARRERFPRVNVDHFVSHWTAGSVRVLRVTVRLSNIGSVLMEPVSIKARVQRLEPVDEQWVGALAQGDDPRDTNESEFPWPPIGDDRTCDWSTERREVEPGEVHMHGFDFVVPNDVRAVAIYSYIRNVKKRDRQIGWDNTTVYFFTKEH